MSKKIVGITIGSLILIIDQSDGGFTADMKPSLITEELFTEINYNRYQGMFAILDFLNSEGARDFGKFLLPMYEYMDITRQK